MPITMIVQILSNMMETGWVMRLNGKGSLSGFAYSFGIKRKAISILLEIQKSADIPLMPALFFISIIYKILSAALLFLLA